MLKPFTTEFYRTADVELAVQLYVSAKDSFPSQQVVIGTEGDMRVLRATGDVYAPKKYALGFAACWRAQKQPDAVSEAAWDRLMNDVSVEQMIGAADDAGAMLEHVERPERFEMA